MNIKKIIGQVIKEARIKKNIKSQDLADEFSVGLATVQGWQRGEVLPPAENFLKVCTYLDIDVNEILKIIKVLEKD